MASNDYIDKFESTVTLPKGYSSFADYSAVLRNDGLASDLMSSCSTVLNAMSSEKGDSSLQSIAAGISSSLASGGMDSSIANVYVKMANILSDKINNFYSSLEAFRTLVYRYSNESIAQQKDSYLATSKMDDILDSVVNDNK